MVLLGFGFLALLYIVAYKVGQSASYRAGYRIGLATGKIVSRELLHQERVKLFRQYANQVGQINVALGTLPQTEILEALRAPTTDKTAVLIARLQRASEKTLLDAKARVAEHTPLRPPTT